jgi:serine/threonine protein phosphatase PrpC
MEPYSLVAATLAVTLAAVTALFVSRRRPIAASASAATLVVPPLPGAVKRAQALAVDAPDEDRSESDEDDVTMVSFHPMVIGPKAALTPEPPLPTPRASPSSKGVRLIARDPEAAAEGTGAGSPLMLLSAVAQTHRGRKRQANEDSFLVAEAHQLFLVADGMGGYAGGEIASREAAETISAMFSSGGFGELPQGVPREGAELVSAIQAANQAILRKAQEDPKLKGMGTTVVSMRFSPKKRRLCIGHVGDSRCYRLRDGIFEMLTSDHTLAAHGVRGTAGGMLTRAVGIDPVLTVDLILAQPQPGDMFLLCSDGLTKMVAEEEISALLASSSDPAASVQALIQRANENGGKDNVTAIVIHVHDGGVGGEWA